MALEPFYHDSQHCHKLRFLYKNDICAPEFLVVKPPISVDTEHHGFYQVSVALPQSMSTKYLQTLSHVLSWQLSADRELCA